MHPPHGKMQCASGVLFQGVQGPRAWVRAVQTLHAGRKFQSKSGKDRQGTQSQDFRSVSVCRYFCTTNNKNKNKTKIQATKLNR